MSKLFWNSTGDRTFELGVDHAVLYPQGSDGVSWNGLLSVSDKSSGNGTTPRYFEGIRYINTPSAAEFSATIEAFTYPPEFEECDGSASLITGVLADEQMPVPFGLSYRTKIGNDVHGADYAYKLHLVYNAIAVPSDTAYTTISDKPVPIAFSWDITTTPVEIPGLRPASHFTIDSSQVSPYALKQLEDILYGTDVSEPRLPSITEVLALRWTVREVIIIDYPDERLLPAYAKRGYFVFVKSNKMLYSFGPASVSDTRPVIVIHGNNTSLLPSDAIAGDLVYDDVGGYLYQLGA